MMSLCHSLELDIAIPMNLGELWSVMIVVDEDIRRVITCL
jgi:hypothetical protein